MIERLTEQTSLWTYLQQTKKPIYLYGMGDGADKILRVLERFGVSISGVFASDEFVRGHSFHGFVVEKLSAVRARHGKDFITLLAFGTFREPLLSYLYELSEELEFYAPDVPVCADDDTLFTPDYVRAHEAAFDRAFSLLSDDWSRKVFLDTLNYKISGKPRYLKGCTTPVEEGFSLLSLGEAEHYADLGAYNGDTVASFLAHTGGRYASILAMEPDAKNHRKLCKRLEALGIPTQCAVHAGAWSKNETKLFSARAGRQSSLSFSDGIETPMAALDQVLDGRPLTYLKLDVEGAEEQALLGAKETIAAYRPKMLLSVYHRNSDLWLLPGLVDDLVPGGYRYYLRHHPYLPAWDNNLYLLPRG